jgi:hypothetical protein
MNDPREDRMRACIGAYVAAWNEPDAAARRALIASACSPELRFITARQRIVGHDGLDAIIADFQRRRPGHRVSLLGSVDIQGHLYRCAGRVDGPMGSRATPLPDAFDAGECDEDGRIRLILTFAGASLPNGVNPESPSCDS